MARRPPARLRQQSQHPVSPKRKFGKNNNTLSPRAANQLTAHKPLGKRLSDSDDSDELVTRGNGRRRGRAAQTVDIYASGALGQGDNPNSHPTRAQRRKQLEEAQNSGKNAQMSPAVIAKALSIATVNKSSPLQNSTTASHSPAVQPRRPVSTANPTPLREESILNGIRPRKRQNSILLEPSLDESTLGSFALPEDENSPLHLPRQRPVSESPQSQALGAGSSSKKRKLGPDDVPTTPAEASQIPRSSPGELASEPKLPSEPKSALRPTSRKERHKILVQDETDIMAPPMSSSSSSSEQSSPAKPAPVPAQRHKSKSKAPPVTLKTSDLQARLMPTKRQKALRARNKNSEFDIPSDSPEDAQDPAGEDDSTFLGPGKRRATRTARHQVPPTATAKNTKPSRRKAPAKAKQTKSSTTPAPLLAPSRSRTPHEIDDDDDEQQEFPAKSPSQLSSISVITPPQRAPIRKGYKSTAGKGRAGGSPLKRSFGKENDDDDGEGGLSGDGGSDDGDGLQLRSPRKTFGGKWAEIDDFEMDFEDVLVDVSSDPLAR